MDKKNKTLTVEAVELFFGELFGLQFKLVTEFLDFLKNDRKNTPIKLDQWSCFLELLKNIGDQFPQGYNVEDSWPTLFDEFYEWYCKKYSIKIEKPEY
jgi:hypothetical protein